jgi:hypothetical protein
MDRVMPRKIVEVLPSGAELTWTEGDDAGATPDALGDGRRVVEVLPSGAALTWTDDDDAGAAAA